MSEKVRTDFEEMNKPLKQLSKRAKKVVAMEIYSVECRKNEGFEKIGEVRNDGGKVTLHFDRPGNQEMFDKFGPKRLTPKDGDRYIQAMIDQFRFSSGIFLTKTIVEKV